jgi:CubicO group peptidase (beta-lactamase class C family)
MKNTRRQFLKASTAVGLGMPFVSLESLAQSPVGLPRATPESQGFDSQAILNFLAAARESGLEWHSYMLLKNGHVISEGWWQPFAAPFKHTMHSMSKAFSSTAIGLLVDEGKLSVTDPVAKYFPDELPATLTDNLKAMTVKHLLTMNTGHDTDTMPELRRNEQQSWVKSFLAHPVIHQPGSHFLYNTGATYMLGAILHKITGQTLEQYLKPRLFDPLGITGYDWEKSPQGLNTAGYGLRISTEDIARFGQLYLQKGMWNGKRLLSESWVADASKRQGPSQDNDGDWGQGYGYQFWRCKPGFYRGDGAFGQFCIVMPEYNMVMALTNESFSMAKTMEVIWENILPGIRQKALPAQPALVAKTKAEAAKLQLSLPQGSKTTAENLHKYSDKIYTVADNRFGIKRLAFGLATGELRVDTGAGFEKIAFGWGSWKVNPNRRLNPFTPQATSGSNGFAVTSRIAAGASWASPSTLQLSLKMVDQIQGDNITCLFEGNSLSLSLLSSQAKGNKAVTDRREKLTATMA